MNDTKTMNDASGARAARHVAAGLLALAVFWAGSLLGGPAIASFGLSGCDGGACAAVNKVFAAVAILFALVGLVLCVQAIKRYGATGSRFAFVEATFCGCGAGAFLGFALVAFGSR